LRIFASSSRPMTRKSVPKTVMLAEPSLSAVMPRPCATDVGTRQTFLAPGGIHLPAMVNSSTSMTFLSSAVSPRMQLTE